MMNAGHIFGTDSVDEASLSSAYVEGRRLIREYLSFYRSNFEGCRDMQLVATAPLMGTRESARILGEYELTYEDFRSRREFDDGIGRCAGSVDIHVYDDTDEEYERYYREFNTIDRLHEGESFAIPYRALLPAGTENLLVAGRCVSTDVKVQGALRIQPAAAVMGEAAGVAATQMVRRGCAAGEVDVEELRSILRDAGAVL